MSLEGVGKQRSSCNVRLPSHDDCFCAERSVESTGFVSAASCLDLKHGMHSDHHPVSGLQRVQHTSYEGSQKCVAPYQKEAAKQTQGRQQAKSVYLQAICVSHITTSNNKGQRSERREGTRQTELFWSCIQKAHTCTHVQRCRCEQLITSHTWPVSGPL
jgi:hypothetical protein